MPATAFTRRQLVRTLYQHSAPAIIVGRHPETFVDGNWYVVRFEDDRGGMGSVHASMLAASNEPPFAGRLPSYASTQR